MKKTTQTESLENTEFSETSIEEISARILMEKLKDICNVDLRLLSGFALKEKKEQMIEEIRDIRFLIAPLASEILLSKIDLLRARLTKGSSVEKNLGHLPYKYLQDHLMNEIKRIELAIKNEKYENEKNKLLGMSRGAMIAEQYNIPFESTILKRKKTAKRQEKNHSIFI